MTQRLLELRSYIKEEVISHLPYTISGLLAGVGFVIIISVLGFVSFSEEQFHTAHYVHIFFSAAASSAIFRSYREEIWKAIPVTLASSLMICSLSDILIPWGGMTLFQLNADWHICVWEHPVFVTFFSALGFIVGYVGIRFFKHCNRSFHLIHILISTAASSLYMMSYTATSLIEHLFATGITLFFALIVPCLIGDVALPLIFVDIKDDYLHEKMHHHA